MLVIIVDEWLRFAQMGEASNVLGCTRRVAGSRQAPLAETDTPSAQRSRMPVG